MKFEELEKSEIKEKFFYRTKSWDWFTNDAIFVVAENSPTFITMDPWPQKIFLDATGKTTVSEYIYSLAKEYPRNQVPEKLVQMILDTLFQLNEKEKLIEFSSIPVELKKETIHPRTEEGIIDMKGIWNGTYTYNVPDEYKDDRLIEVKFRIEVLEVKKNIFSGTVKDDLESGGTSGIGTISGSCTETEIKYIKQMPIYAYIDKEGNHLTNPKRKHLPIIYEGSFSRSKKHITGIWKFKKKRLVFINLIPRLITNGSGHFTMTKED